MRKLFLGGTALILAVGIVALAAGWRGGWSTSSPDGEPEAAYNDDYTPPAEPEPVAEALPEQPVPIQPAPQVEVINVLETQLAALRSKEAAANDRAEPELEIPVLYKVAEEDYGPMPLCVDEEDGVPAQMPYIDEPSSPLMKPCAGAKAKQSGPAKESRTATFVGFFPLPF
jgi:hypothetical protein